MNHGVTEERKQTNHSVIDILLQRVAQFIWRAAGKKLRLLIIYFQSRDHLDYQNKHIRLNNKLMTCCLSPELWHV